MLSINRSARLWHRMSPEQQEMTRHGFPVMRYHVDKLRDLRFLTYARGPETARVMVTAEMQFREIATHVQGLQAQPAPVIPETWVIDSRDAHNALCLAVYLGTAYRRAGVRGLCRSVNHLGEVDADYVANLHVIYGLDSDAPPAAWHRARSWVNEHAGEHIILVTGSGTAGLDALLREQLRVKVHKLYCVQDPEPGHIEIGDLA